MSINTLLRATNDEISAIKNWHGRSNEDLNQDLDHLQAWLSKQPHLPHDIKDAYLEKLLRLNKFSLEKTKKKIDNYFSIKHLVPEFFDDRDLLSPKMQFHMDNVFLVPLPKLTKKFSRVHIFNFNNPNSDTFDIIRHANYVFAAADLRFFFDECITDTYIIDMKNCTMGHVIKHTPVLLKKAFTVVQQAYSDRIQAVHFINLPNYANVLVTICQSLLNEKLSKRVYVHKDLDSLHKLVPKEILPSEYKGTEKSIVYINDDWRKLLEDNNNWLMEMGQKRSNEKLRHGPAISSDIFGSIHGSFRQLNVD